jgi:hypothetical protein
MENKNKLSAYIDTVYLALGEVIVGVLVAAAFLLFGKFSYTVVTGALLGGAVTVVNFLILSVSVNRAVTKYITERGDKEMDEEEAEKYAREHGMVVQNAMTRSYLLRMGLMIGALVLGMVSGFFSPLATVIPLLMYRPILYVTELIKIKLQTRRGD